jgi:stage V sporulation protein S
VTTAAPEPAAPPRETEVATRRSPHGEEMRVSASSNPQSLASAISHAIYDNRAVTLRAIGAGSICQAQKALAIARGFVAPRGYDLAVVPGWANVTGSRGDELSAMTFRVIQLQ